MATFFFNGHTLRTAIRTVELYELARQWVAADPDHRETTPAEFWFEQKMGTESYILEFKDQVVLFFKLVRNFVSEEVEIHLQFPPAAAKTSAQQWRVMAGMIRGLEWVERALVNRKVSTLFFTSKSATLIRFAEKRLGFEQKNGRLQKTIQIARAVAAK